MANAPMTGPADRSANGSANGPLPDRLQVGIVPHDVGVSLTFYRDVLGLTYAGTRPGLEQRTLHFFTLGTATVKLLEPSGPPPRRSARASYTESEGIRWLTLDVADLDAIVRRCRDARSRFQLEPTEVRAGIRVAIVEDPDGNAIELVERA